MSSRRSSLSPRASRRLKKQAARGRSRVGVFSRLNVLRQEQLEDRRLLSVNLLGSFAGMTIDSNTGGTLYSPPDACGAASPGTTYVETVNQQVTIYNKTSGAAAATDNLNHFLITTGGLPRTDAVSSLFDPSMTYDDQIGRFIVTDMDYDFDAGHVSRFDFAVSKSSDPATLTAADWNFYQLDPSENDGTPSGTFDADFPGNLGWNHDAFVVTLNMFSVDGSSAHVQVNSVSNADLMAGVSQANLHVYRNDDSDALSLRPAVMHDSKAGDPMWFVDQAGTNAIEVYKMTNVLSNSASFVGTQLPVNPYNDIHASGVYPKQPDGTTVTTNQDSRIQKVAEANNLLVASQAVNVSATENDARWYEIDVSSGTPALKGQGNVSGGDNTYAAYPAIDINASGDIGMTYMRSGTDSPTDFLSMWVTGRAPTDAAGTMQTPVLAQAGAANYSDSSSNGSQAGDFSGISADADGSFFATTEFATNRNGNNWGTEVAHFSLSGSIAPPNVVYVNAAWSALGKGQAITDADPVTTGNQSAVFGTTAFATVGAALAAVAPGGTVYVNSGDYRTESVSLANNDTLALLGTAPGSPGAVAFGSLTGAAGTTVDTGSVGGLVNNLREGALQTSTSYAGVLSGPGSLTVVGGSLTLTGSGNSYAGGTNINSGTLMVDGTAGSGAVIVGSGATLGGTGTIAGPLTVSAGGTVSPGDPTSGPGLLATGPLTLLGTYTAQVNGATSPGNNYDQFATTGAATLTGGGLTLTLGYAPSAGDSIVLISGGAAIVGPVSVNGSVVNEGGHVMLSFGGLNYDFKASYAGDKLTLTLDENPTINVDSFAGGVSHTIDVSTSGGNTLVTVDGNTVFNESTAVLTGLTLDAASANDTFNVHSIGVATTINGGTGSDTFVVTGRLAAGLTIAGGRPAAGPGDLIQFDAGAKPVTISATTLMQTGSGTLTYNGIANLRITNDAGITLQGADNTANAVMLSRDLAAGTLNDITLNGGATIAVSTASSLDYVGGGGTASNQLTIDEDANGLPTFTGTAAGMHTNSAFAGSNANPANIGVNVSGGGSGANSLVINFTQSHDVADYSDNAGSTGSGVAAVASGLNVSYGNLASLAFNGSGGTLTLTDAANPTVTSLTVSDPTPGSGQTVVSGNGAWAAAALAGFGSLSVQGNNANDNTIVLSGADAATVGGQGLANITLQGGSGNDTITVESLSAGITATLLGGDGANHFNLDGAGGSHDLTNIAGPLNISPVGDSTSASDTLSIDDSSDQSQRTVTITPTTIAGITGGGASSVAYDGSGRIQTVNIAGGNSGNEFDIQGTNQSVAQGYTINTGAGADTVNVSSDAPTNRGTLAEIQAPVFLNTQGGGDSLNVSDLGSAGANYSIAAGATLGSTTLSTGSANITYDANGTAGQLAHFNLTGGNSGNDQFSVNLPSLGESTTLRISANSVAGGNTVALTADPGVADALTVTPTAADAGLVSDTQLAGGTTLGSVAYSGMNAIQLIGQVADGDTAEVVAKAGDELTFDLAAQTVAETGFAGISVTGFGTVNLDAAGAAVDLVDKATDDNLTVTSAGPTRGTAQATSTGQIVNFNAARLNVDLPNGNRVIVKTSSPASTLVADETDRTIWATTSDGTKLMPVVLSPAVTTVELDGGTGKTTFVVAPAPGLLPSGTSDVVGSPNFEVPNNLVVAIVGGGAAADSKLVVANYDTANGKLTPLGNGLFAVDDRASATSGTLHLYHGNGANGSNQYPDVGYRGVGAVDVETPILTGHLSTEAVANWIVQLYVQLLGREPAISEVTFWMRGVQSGLSVQQVSGGFVASHEYRAEQINLLYEKYLGRKADSVGLAYSIALWNASGGPDQVLQVILGSPEFYARARQLHPDISPDAAWVTALYQDLLGRDPEPQGTAAWVNYVQAHGKQGVVLIFVASDEYRSDAISNLFQTYLGRPVDSMSAPGLLQAMRQGLTQDQLLTIIVSSDEFINKTT